MAQYPGVLFLALLVMATAILWLRDHARTGGDAKLARSSRDIVTSHDPRTYGVDSAVEGARDPKIDTSFADADSRNACACWAVMPACSTNRAVVTWLGRKIQFGKKHFPTSITSRH